MTEQLLENIRDRSARIAVIGCGYVGLPLAVAFARAGFGVCAIDSAEERVASIKAGKSYLMDVPTAELAPLVADGRLSATIDYSTLRDADVIFVCVPTPFDRAKAPDLTYVVQAAQGIAANLRRGQLVILESTTYPGTTEEVLLPILEAAGLKAGTDFWLAFSPERIDPGNRTHTITNTAKVVGGVDPVSTELACVLLQQVISAEKVHAVSSPRVAELTKLLENVYRSVNIALVNELALLCDRMGIDVWEVIEAASSKPYGFTPFYPGPGVGGHCIPVDPYYLAWKAREYDFSTKFIELAAETNQHMPFFTVDKLRRTLQRDGQTLRDGKILVLGAAFKPDVDDARNSPAIRTMEILRTEGAAIEYHDPHIPSVPLNVGLYRSDGTCDLRSVALTPRTLSEADCVLILVRHRAVDYAMVASHARRIFDAVNAMRGLDVTKGTLTKL